MKEKIIPINEVDRFMRKTVVELNMKCYWTRSACQGHSGAKGKRMQSTFISFEGWITFPEPPPMAATVSRRESTGSGKRTIVRWWEFPDPERVRGINDRILEWARKLPSACNRRKLKFDVKLDLGDGSELVDLEVT